MVITMVRSGKLHRGEPKAPDLLEVYPEIQWHFQEAGWEQFFSRCVGYHNGVVRDFVEGFDGQHVSVGGISFFVIEELIGEVTGLDGDGEESSRVMFWIKLMCCFSWRMSLRRWVGVQEFKLPSWRTSDIILYGLPNLTSHVKDTTIGWISTIYGS